MTMLQQDDATKDSLMASFEDKPVSCTGQCPLQQQEVAIFPVRYALDEAPENPDEPGPNPIPAGWQGHQSLPRLNKRTYTLRQLRDGWLYVVNRTTNTLDEYQVLGASFSKVSGGDSEDGGLPSCGASTTHLLYPRDNDLLLAYSSVQWTSYTRERMSDPDLQSRWMRPLDLANYVRTLDAPHCAPLKQLAETVADIDPGRAEAGQRFDSTTTPSEQVDSDDQYKPVVGSDTILGSVPDQDSALFIALDDTLGMLDDLSMQAAGPAIELAQFEAEHMHRLTVAQYVEMLAGTDFSELQTQMNLNQEEFHEFKQKAQEYLTARARHRRDTQNASQFGGISSSINATRLEHELAGEYGRDVLEQVNVLTELWDERRDLRSQVRFEEAQQFALEKQRELEILQAALSPGLEDLIVWLERLGSDPLCVFHDQTDEGQCHNLISHADTWLGLLSQDQSGHNWFIQDYAAPKTLIGLAHYNFDAELASGIEQLANEFIEQDSISLATATSVAKRTQEVADVLSNETIRNSRHFQRLSAPAKRAFDTLVKVASTHFESLWEGFEYKLLPAISKSLGPRWQTVGYMVITIVVQTEIEEIRPYVIKDPEYRQKHTRWSRRVLQVTRQLNAQMRVAQMGNRHDRMPANRQVQQLKRQLDNLMLEMPNEILARGEVRIQHQSTEIQQRIHAIQTQGRAELAQQMEAKARDYGTYVKKVNDWVKNNVNKGLAGLITALNIWNVHAAMVKARSDGEWSQDDTLSVGNAAATMLSGLTALSLMPLWNRMAQLVGEASVRGNTVQVRLVDAAAKYWSKGHAQHAALFRVFAVRAVAMSGLAVIASVAEWFEVNRVQSSAKSDSERRALLAKKLAVSVMGFFGGLQLAGAIGAHLGVFSAGAVFAPWLLISLAVVGVLYLIASVVAERLKLEGFRLWLYRSSWGRSNTSYWPDTEEGNKDELRALHEVLLRPVVLAKTLKGSRSDRNNPNSRGLWLKLILPPDVAGHDISLYPIMVTEGGWFTSDRQASYRSNLYANFFAQGNWVSIDQVAQWDGLDAATYRDQPSAQYEPGDWRVWLVHLPHSHGMDRMELEIHYPPVMLRRPDGLGYRFSIDLSGMQTGTLHENPYVHGQVTEPDDSGETLVIDSIPARSRNILTLGVL